MSQRVLIQNFPAEQNAIFLRTLLENYGPIEWIFVELDANTGLPWGYAYISFAKDELASAVVALSLNTSIAVGNDDKPWRLSCVELGPDLYVDKSSLLNSPEEYIYSSSKLIITDAPAGSQITLNGIVKGEADTNGLCEIDGLLPGDYKLMVTNKNITICQNEINIPVCNSLTISARLKITGPLSLKQYGKGSTFPWRAMAVILIIILLPLAYITFIYIRANAPTSPVVKATPTPPPGMVYVPPVRFIMGRYGATDSFESPAHVIDLPKDFFLDRTEVSNRQYAEFVEATNHEPPPYWGGKKPPEDILDLPVVRVNWADANAYCHWRNFANNSCRLPSEKEWEAAARGSDGLLYPWGNQWRDDGANANKLHNQLMPVDSYARFPSPYGAINMVGNVWEWVNDDLAIYPLSHAQPQPGVKVIRGGAYDSKPEEATGSFRGFVKPESREYNRTGFRCVCDTP